ncbi:hypothetical protein KKH3_11350 [Pectobacterium actinidiae]|nr:hypothetical protein KKH3_11350 [Pectobacterium actinidiae]
MEFQGEENFSLHSEGTIGEFTSLYCRYFLHQGQIAQIDALFFITTIDYVAITTISAYSEIAHSAG